MKAALYRTHGGPEVLEYADLRTRYPGPATSSSRLRRWG